MNSTENFPGELAISGGVSPQETCLAETLVGGFLPPSLHVKDCSGT